MIATRSLAKSDVGVFGLARTGMASLRSLKAGGARVFAWDDKDETRRLAAAEERFRAAGWPAVFTFHPWELDPAHPPMPGLSPLTRLVHFYNLGATLSRFEAWLARGEDRCVALADVLPELAA